MGMKTLTLFLATASVCWSLEISLRIKNDPQCKFKGQQCSEDLRKIIYCTAKGGDSYTVTECKHGESCEKKGSEFRCSADKVPGPPRNDIPFTCKGEETYPDPNWCNTAYICAKSGSHPKLVCKCPEGSALILNQGMTCTTNKMVLDQCKCPSLDRCAIKGPGKSDFGNCHPSFYHDCVSDESGGLVAHVYKCPPGQYFLDGKCQSPTLTVNLDNSTSQDGGDPTCEEYLPPCFLEADVKCTKKGELLPHKKIDRCYHWCDSNLKPVVKDCGPGSYFTCKYGQCGCAIRQESY